MKRTLMTLAALADRMAEVKGPEPVRADRLLAAARGELEFSKDGGDAPKPIKEEGGPEA